MPLDAAAVKISEISFRGRGARSIAGADTQFGFFDSAHSKNISYINTDIGPVRLGTHEAGLPDPAF